MRALACTRHVEWVLWVGSTRSLRRLKVLDRFRYVLVRISSKIEEPSSTYFCC